MSAIRAYPYLGFYGISKAALDMFTQSLALELAPFGIRVNSVNPGVVITQLQERAGMPRKALPTYVEISNKANPSKRIGEVEEIAEVIAFLASSKASYITGNLTPIDGGQNLVCLENPRVC